MWDKVDYTMIIKLLEKLQKRSRINDIQKHCPLQNVRIGVNNHFQLYPSLKKLKLGKNINFRNYTHIIVGENATLEIGDNVFMNNFCSINCLDFITIGEGTLFGENVKLYDHNHHHENTPNPSISHTEFTYAPIKIGKNCWLGSNVTVLKGVNIGDNCIIGAGCTIYKNVPPNTTVINKQELMYKNR